MKSKYTVVGLMSGTSLDGLDITHCIFQKFSSGWKYSISKSATIKYPARWLQRLTKAHLLSGEELIQLDADYGAYLGKVTLDFIHRNNLKVDFISSHGHTVFHQPLKGFTYQIGNGFSLFAASQLPVVNDFRSQDVALGGEGAPLVPVGDKLLFGEYDVCLNLGGIANLSADKKGKRYAFDVCFCNMGLNYLAGKVSKSYDKNGAMAASGTVNEVLLKSIQKIYSRYQAKRPSLGREIFESQIQTLLENKKISLEDRLSTLIESAAIEITNAIKSLKTDPKVLCTGGGCFNSFLIARMLEHGGDEITFIIPDEEVVKFKEAIVFAFLGVLRVRDEINCLKTVTKATRNSSSGTMIGF
ncbi:MAG: anhydro-N-acetylmuramic acid kinase [Cyclobacteriaceae bacterium]